MPQLRYATPFLDLFRKLTPAERRELRDSIVENGNVITYAVQVYQSKKYGTAILDGIHRFEIAEELGIDCPMHDLGEMADADARELAEQLNHCRRHLSGDDWRRMATARAERIKRVAEKRQEGKSLRVIAEEEDVSLGQVQRDIKEAGVSPDTPENGTVTGKDGKQYSATKPAPTFDDYPDDDPPEPVNQDASADADNGSDVQTERDDTPRMAPQNYPERPKGKAPPPKKEYPEPYAGLLDGLTDLSGKFTRFINSPESETFRTFLGTLKLPWINYTRAKWEYGKGKTNPNWRAFHALRALLIAAHRNRKIKTFKQLHELIAEEGGDVLSIPEEPTHG